MNSKRLVIAGGSGFIGTALAQEFIRRGWLVTILTRTPRLQRLNGIQEIAWDGAKPGPWGAQLDGADALINLTGKNINCPHTAENLRDITASRVNSVQALAAAIRQNRTPPRVWVQASATGFYGDTTDRACAETGPGGSDALSIICREWENAFTANLPAAVRAVTLRIGFVLGQGGGALPVLAKLTKNFLGGAVGSGRQYISWIHLADLVHVFAAAVEDATWSGTYNAVAPNAVTNAAFMRELRRVLHRPWSPPAPAFAVRLGARFMGSEPSLALISQRCLPARLEQAKFLFRFPELPAALQDLCGKK